MRHNAGKSIGLGWVLLMVVTLMVGGIWGCASTPWSSDNEPGSDGGQRRPMAYDFPDVKIPSEMELVPKASYVFQGPKTKAGLLVFKGRVEGRSVVDFFQNAMPRENWLFKGGFRTRRSVLVFEKPEKICLVNIYEATYYTYVEVYLTPVGGPV